MAPQDEQDPTPSLAPPSLSPPRLFGRRRPTSGGDPATGVDRSEPGDTQVVPDVDDAAGFTDAGTDPYTAAATDDATDDAQDAPASPAQKPSGSRLPRLPRIPRIAVPAVLGTGGTGLPRHVGAPAAGLLTGIVLLGFIWVGLRGCDAVGNTQTCSPGAGLTVLVVIFALTVVVGRLLLGLLKVREPVMTSFLAVGLTSLVAVLGPEWLIDSAATVVLVPLLCAAAFAAASWVATLEVDLDD